MKKLIVGLVIALGLVFFIQVPAEACCGFGDDRSNSSGYDWGRSDDWSGRDDTYGYQDRSLIDRYDSDRYGIGSDLYDMDTSREPIKGSSWSTDTFYNPDQYVGTDYDWELHSNYNYDSRGYRSYHYPAYERDSFSYKESYSPNQDTDDRHNYGINPYSDDDYSVSRSYNDPVYEPDGYSYNEAYSLPQYTEPVESGGWFRNLLCGFWC